ncbi:hypothetical protein HanLR1_Chr09g0308861 [Helianthus annuus]|nr:hypothetical protein HanHA89_Chr09g0329421 [Helianthus annuus]KAJ0706598.1 hypothetical protein HanLR1_Chr09g0308861 [Helianthus annuus]
MYENHCVFMCIRDYLFIWALCVIFHLNTHLLCMVTLCYVSAYKAISSPAH